ncbi:hypothetical protein GARC_0190 [Paraglaciecola arctica BSs20135]|uniref:Uncharacterized protein n=1 Tax=Paraglaciecola arctica BSs20135 TaxID=493475 RepID=K6YG83_9ALTE|nr:hypothetical protein GARC_0190 [Paraglaciecola arctica BSs20135]
MLLQKKAFWPFFYFTKADFVMLRNKVSLKRSEEYARF